MAILTIMQECPEHIAHGENVDVACWGEATAVAFIWISQNAVIDEIPELMGKWLAQAGSDAVTLEYDDEFGKGNCLVFS